MSPFPRFSQRVRGALSAPPSKQSDVAYLISSGFWLNANSLVVMVLAFAISIAYANLLPKEVFGTYQYLLSLFSILSAFTLTGMNAAISRAVAQGHERSLQDSIPYQLRWNLIGSAIALVAAGYYALHASHTLSIGALLIALALPLTSSFNSYAAFLTGKKAFRNLFAYSTAASLLYYVCILVGIIYFPSVLGLIFINLFTTALGTMAAYFWTVRTFKPTGSTDPDLFTYGKHLTVMNLFGTVAGQLDNVLVFHFLGPAQLATYSFATLIPERLSGFLKNLTNSALPRFAEQHMSTIRSRLLVNALLLTLFTLAGIVLYVLLAPVFFSYVYPQYQNAVLYSQVFAFTLLAAVGNFIGTSLLAHRRIRRLYALNTVSPIAQLALQVGGVIYGGLWGLIIARIIWTFFFLVLVIPLTVLDPKK